MTREEKLKVANAIAGYVNAWVPYDVREKPDYKPETAEHLLREFNDGNDWIPIMYTTDDYRTPDGEMHCEGADAHAYIDLSGDVPHDVYVIDLYYDDQIAQLPDGVEHLGLHRYVMSRDPITADELAEYIGNTSANNVWDDYYAAWCMCAAEFYHDIGYKQM